MHSNNNRITMVNTLLVTLLLFCVFSCVLVDPQSSGFTFSFETPHGVKRAYSYGTPDFHGTYFYYTNDGTRHVVNFGGSERGSGSFVALTASRAVGPPAPARYPITYPPTPAPAPGPAPVPALVPARPPIPYPLAPAPPSSYDGYTTTTGGYGGGYGGAVEAGGGPPPQSIAPGLVASAVGGGLG